MILRSLFFLAISILCFQLFSNAETPKSYSVYQSRVEDGDAIYFTPDHYQISNDGKTDVSDALQEAIRKVKHTSNYGIVFIPEGRYLISKTIYIPRAVRLIGYGKKRPEFVLGKNSPGFQVPDLNDKGMANYLFWFVSDLHENGEGVDDANAGTFYSAFSNINIRIEDGNPTAVALRTHYAQHSFVSHCDINIGNGKAGMFDVGNEMEDVHFFGGDYGIYTTKTSPSWPFMMVDTYFENQKKAAIKTREAGLNIVRMTVKNTPIVIDIDSNFIEKLYMEDCQLINISKTAILISEENNSNSQISIKNVDCAGVPLFASFRKSGNIIPAKGPLYKVNKFYYGLMMDGLGEPSDFKTINEMVALTTMPSPKKTDLPSLPATAEWINIKTLGAKGDGETDDTKAIQNAIDNNKTIYFPQGIYRVTETIKLKPTTVLIGLNPVATQLMIKNNTEAFGGFGAPKALLETSKGGSNIVTGIGINTNETNTRAVGCKWIAGAESYMNDVKFLGGHGTMSRDYKDRSWYHRDCSDPTWDSQYWSLWITDGGGGSFKDIWSASTFASSGVYISNTSTSGRIYALSVEHHVRNEVRFKNVSNWKVYALQLEEEGVESINCQPLELENCSNVLFTNLYLFRTIRANTPYPQAIRTWNCKQLEFNNVHNFAQVRFTMDLTLLDVNSGLDIRPWDFTRLVIGEIKPQVATTQSSVKKLAKGFEFAEGSCTDSKGNFYFSEFRMRRIYKWDASTNSLGMIADFPWEPMSLATDKNDNLLVAFKYKPKQGHLVNGIQEKITNPDDAEGTSFSKWGNNGFDIWVYAIDPSNPEESIQLIKKVAMGVVKNVYKALYPAHRWRDSYDFNTVLLNKASQCWLAPDNATIIPVCYDLARSSSMVEAFPGKLMYPTDEFGKRTVAVSVNNDGSLTDLKEFAPRGEFSSAIDKNGNVYIAEGDIYVYNKTGKLMNIIKIPERPSSLSFGGHDGNTLFITARIGIYSFYVK